MQLSSSVGFVPPSAAQSHVHRTFAAVPEMRRGCRDYDGRKLWFGQPARDIAPQNSALPSGSSPMLGFIATTTFASDDEDVSEALAVAPLQEPAERRVGLGLIHAVKVDARLDRLAAAGDASRLSAVDHGRRRGLGRARRRGSGLGRHRRGRLARCGASGRTRRWALGFWLERRNCLIVLGPRRLPPAGHRRDIASDEAPELLVFTRYTSRRAASGRRIIRAASAASRAHGALGRSTNRRPALLVTPARRPARSPDPK